MKLRPGCGCLVLVLGILNLLLVFLMTWGLIRGTASRSPQAFTMLLVFISDVIICLIVGLAAVRSRKLEAANAQTEGTEGEESGTSDTDDM